PRSSTASNAPRCLSALSTRWTRFSTIRKASTCIWRNPRHIPECPICAPPGSHIASQKPLPRCAARRHSWASTPHRCWPNSAIQPRTSSDSSRRGRRSEVQRCSRLQAEGDDARDEPTVPLLVDALLEQLIVLV